jgi:hypothetical protein
MRLINVFLYAVRIYPVRISVCIQFILIVFLTVLFLFTEFKELDYLDNPDSIRTYFIPSLLTASSIFSGLIITYLITRLASIRNERIARLPEIDSLSNKLTQYRKVLHHFLQSSFFKNYSTFKKTLLSNPDYTWSNISISTGDWKSETMTNFYKEPYHTDMALYLALEEIVNEHGDDMAWQFSANDDLGRRYSLDEVVNARLIANELWDYFDNNWHDYGMDSKVDFNCHGLTSTYWTDFIYRNLAKIDVKYAKHQLNRQIISKLSGEFYSIYLERLIFLVHKNNERISPYIRMMFINLLFMAFGGIILPLSISFLKLGEATTYTLASICVSTVLVSVLSISFFLYQAWRIESDVSDY